MNLNEVKPAMWNNSEVSYTNKSYYIEDGRYYIQACILRLIKGEWCYQLELYDMNAKRHSVIIADMNDVNIVK